MRILLINPGSKFLINDKAFPAMGLLYLSAYLKNSGYTDVTLIDMSDGYVLSDNINYDIVGVYSNTPQFPEALRIIRRVKELNINSNPVYVMGGPHVSVRPWEAAADAISVVGEGEQSFLDIVTRKDKGLPQESLYKSDYIKNLDLIPFPDRDIIDINSYEYHINGIKATSIITSRGCPYGCYFCANNSWGKSLRMRSPENIGEEIRLLRDKYDYRAFMFWDDTMTVSRSRMEKLCSMFKELDITYRCNIRSDTVDLDILKMMKDSGCAETAIGIESGSQKILDTINKGETVQKNMEAVKNCHKAGLRVKGFFIVGLPGETFDTVNETKKFLEEAKLDDADFSVYSPYPGSYIYNNRDKFDISFYDNYEESWYKGIAGKYKALVSTSGLSSEDIVSIREEMEKKYKGKV